MRPKSTNNPDVDMFAEKALQEGYYDVDCETGVVTSLRRQISLKATFHSGYPSVKLAINGSTVRIDVHRLIAVKAWGADAIRGKEVAHLDRIRNHNVLGNLAPMIPKDHVLYDGTWTNLGNGRPPKASWPPCVRCGDKDGPVAVKQRTPGRINGARFGFYGALCLHCYHRLHDRARSPRRRRAP